MALSVCGVQVDGRSRELKKHGTTRFPAALYHDWLEQEPVLWHWHDEMETGIVERGCAALCVDGETHKLRPGEGFFANASALHSVLDADSSDCLVRFFVFHPRLVGGSLDSVFHQDYVEPVMADPALRCLLFRPGMSWEAEAISCIDRAWNACLHEAPGFELEARHAASQLLFLVAQQKPASAPRKTVRALHSEERIKAMLTFVQENYGDPITVADIAASAAVSESECLRCFRKMLGTTPGRYLREFRVERAGGLLASTDLRIADIAALCGFEEQGYFTRVFRQATGSTPRDYRASKQTNGA